jgi:hypothetical protein
MMRIGQSLEEKNVNDVEWWIEHKNEIQFAFQVLAGLGLAESVALSRDERDMERVELEEAAGKDSDEDTTWEVKPPKALMGLYRKAVSTYLRERNKRLSYYS